MNDVKITPDELGGMNLGKSGKYIDPSEVAALREHFAAEPHTTDARDAVATIRAHSMIHEGVCLTANDVDAIVSELNRLAAERLPKNMQALVEEARNRSEQRWPIPVNYLEGDPERILLDAKRHAYLLGRLDAAAEQPASPTPSTEQIEDVLSSHLSMKPSTNGWVGCECDSAYIVSHNEHLAAVLHAALTAPTLEQAAPDEPSPLTLTPEEVSNLDWFKRVLEGAQERADNPWKRAVSGEYMKRFQSQAALVSPVSEQPTTDVEDGR